MLKNTNFDLQAHIQLLKKYLPSGEMEGIAERAGASLQYAKKILYGFRPARSELSKKIIWELEQVVLTQEVLEMSAKEFVSLWFQVQFRRKRRAFWEHFLKDHLEDDVIKRIKMQENRKIYQ